MTDRTRLSPARRAEALAVGLYQVGPGKFVPLREIHDSHLVNALLKALSYEEEAVAHQLALEVRRRGIEDYAAAMAAERDGGHHGGSH